MAIKRTQQADMTASLKLYRRIAVTFGIIVAALLAIVIYVSVVQAVIRVTPVQETIKTDFILDVVKTPTRDSEIRGRVVEKILGQNDRFIPSGQGSKIVIGAARATVTIKNDSASDQPLVKTTRLLSSDGILFHIAETVTVPAGGSIDVEAYADKEGATGDIGPTRFTIPGLNASRQQVVYAESIDSFTGGSSEVAVISQTDIDTAVVDLKSRIEQDAMAILRKEVGDVFDGESYLTTVVQQESDFKPGDEASAFNLALTVKVVGVYYDTENIKRLALVQLYNELGQGREFIEINDSRLQSVVEKYDTKEEKANVRVYLDGRAVPSATSAALDPSRFVGMTENEIAIMLIGEGVAKDISIKFAPFWVKKVPKLRDHIFVEIQ